MVDWWRVYLGRWWSAQSDLQRKLKFHCNWWTWWKETECCLEHCKSACLCNPCLNIYNNFERWHHVDFHLFVLQLFVTKADIFLYFWTAGAFLWENVQVFGFWGCFAFGRKIVRTQLLEELQRWKLEPASSSQKNLAGTNLNFGYYPLINVAWATKFTS